MPTMGAAFCRGHSHCLTRERGANTKQAERAGVRDAGPQGRDAPWRGSIHGSLTPQAARHQRHLAQARGNPYARR
jgi:hypothetical protein